MTEAVAGIARVRRLLRSNSYAHMYTVAMIFPEILQIFPLKLRPVKAIEPMQNASLCKIPV
jgi:hypothetical protein